MSTLGNRRGRLRSARHQLALGALLVVLAAAALLSAVMRRPTTDVELQRARVPVGSAPTAVLNARPTRPTRSPHGRSQITASDLARARRAGATFIASYLPVLYGQGRRSLRDATAAVRRELAQTRRPPIGVRRRRPRLTALDAQPQTPTTVLTSATIDDGALAPFRIVFTVERRAGGRWLVSSLAND